MAPPQGRKKSQGRKKIEIKLIEDENARMATFSKRKVGLFKKATELSILCGAQIALIIFCLSGRVHSFGHPTVESVIARFRNRNPMQNLEDSVDHGTRVRAGVLQELKDQCDKKKQELETKKRRSKDLEEALESSSYQLTEESLDQLDINQLRLLKEKMEKLREFVLTRSNAPQVDSVEPPKSMNHIEPVIPGPMELASIDRYEREASPIPPDWLKLGLV